MIDSCQMYASDFCVSWKNHIIFERLKYSKFRKSVRWEKSQGMESKINFVNYYFLKSLSKVIRVYRKNIIYFTKTLQSYNQLLRKSNTGSLYAHQKWYDDSVRNTFELFCRLPSGKSYSMQGFSYLGDSLVMVLESLAWP